MFMSFGADHVVGLCVSVWFVVDYVRSLCFDLCNFVLHVRAVECFGLCSFVFIFGCLVVWLGVDCVCCFVSDVFA